MHDFRLFLRLGQLNLTQALDGDAGLGKISFPSHLQERNEEWKDRLPPALLAALWLLKAMQSQKKSLGAANGRKFHQNFKTASRKRDTILDWESCFRIEKFLIPCLEL